MAITINTGASQTYDGVTYTATSDAVLNIDDAGKVSGLASGSVKATVSGAASSPTVTFDATDGAMDFSATGNGSVLTTTRIFGTNNIYPIEFIKGEFIYSANKITISAGSVLANVNKLGNYSLRNENIFEFGGTYTFTSTALTTESQHTTSTFTLSNGTETRTLNLEAYGKIINTFAERGFTLTKGSSEVINIGNYKLTATAIDDAALNLSLGANGVTLIPTKGDGTLKITLTRGDTTILSGELECTSGEITFGFDKAITFAAGTSFNFTQGDYVLTASTSVEASIDISLTGTGLSFKPHDNDGALNLLITKGGKSVFGGALNVTGGAITFDSTTQEFSFTKGTNISLALPTGQQFDMQVINDDATIKVVADGAGNFTITPAEGDGALSISISNGDKTVFQNTLNVSGGSIIFNPTTQEMTLTNGTTVSLVINDNYTLTATASGNATSTISLSTGGISITPSTAEGDGTLNLTLTGTSSGSLSANIEILSGGFLFGTSGTLSVVEGTELKIDFGNDYIINFKATDAAGGAISLGTDGITFAPNSSDGGLELSITRGDEKRTASLDVTGGSVTYKLDGSISLTKGTVVKNVFDSGNILTIEANTDASGSIYFNPQTGLTIKPSTPDALTATLTTGDLEVAKFTSITGSITYSGGVVTATDGTTANLRLYDTLETKLSATGGTASIQFTGDRTVYTANDGATFVLDYLDGSTVEIQNGMFSDIYATDTADAIELISEGSTFRCNDKEFLLTLEKAGNYNLNGMDVTTTEDNVQVSLADYNTVILTQGAEINFATTLSGSSLDVTATATQGQPSVTLDDDGNITYDATDATLQLAIGLEKVIGESVLPNVFTISGGSVTMGATDADGLKSISIKAGTELSFTQNDTTFKGVVQNDINGRLWMREGRILYLHSYDEAVFDTTATLTNGNEVFKGTVTLDGAFSYSAERGTVGLVDSNTYNVHDSSIQIAVGNQTFKFTTKGDTFFAALSTDGNGKLTFDFNNDKYNTMLFAIIRDSKEVYNATIKISGPIVLDPANSKFSIAEGTSFSIVRDERVITFTADKDISTTYKVEEGIYYFTLDDEAAANISITSGEQTIFAGGLTAGGVLSFNPTTGTFGLTGANSSHGNGTNTFAELTTANGYGIKLATNDTTVVFIPTITDGKFDLNFPNENKHEMAFTLSKDGQTILERQIIVDGTIGFDIASQELHLTKDTALSLSPDGENWLKITALDDASGQLQFTDSGIRFAPNAGDGQLELNFVATDRKANIDVSTGAIILGNDGMMSLEKDTVLTLTWEDGTTLKMTASDTGGSIGFDAQGLKISSDGELSIDLTAGDLKTTMSNLKGSIHYLAGKVLFDENSTLTATSSLGGLPTNITLVSNGTGGYIEVSATGTRYVAGTGAFQNTWSRDGKQSTFSFSDGAIYIGHGIFQVSEGISLSTDLQDLVPTLYFTTTDPGNYTVNGQTITTSAENLKITAIDDYMYFTTSDNAVTYDGMTFTGDGTITINNSSAVNCDATNGALQISIPLGSIIGETILANTFDISGGTITFDSPNNKITCAAGTTLSFTQAGQTITLTTSKDINIDINNTGSGFIQEISLDKGTVLTLTIDETALEVTALDDAGGQLSFIDGGIRFAPNENDGALELNFVSTGRKASLNVTGAIILDNDGKISLEDGTEVNLDWEDGTNLKLNSHGSTGSIAFGEKGIRISSEDENLDMTLTTPDGYSATITSIQGAVWYNAGTVTLDANTSMTGKNIVEGRTIGIKVEAIDGDASLTFSNVGFTYNAGDGKTRVTYTLGDEESSFTLNKGSVFIQGRVFHIAEGSDLATDFKDFIPAQYFQTQEAGTYTINGHTITTTAANLALTATDDYMSFTTSDDVVTYDGMNFAGAGKVSISSGGVVLGAGVEATGFGLDKSFILAETGSVTADERIFELTEDVPTGISVTGTQDGFIFSRTNTEESEARFENPDPVNIGKIFTEEFSLSNDNAYRIQTDLLGLQQIIGVTAPVTVVGSASFGGEPEETIFDIVTNSEGVFNVDEKPYTISGDSSVAIMVGFNPDQSYVRGFKDLNGTVSGDFTEHAVSINGGTSILISGDSSIDLVAGANGVELFGVSGGVSLMEMGGVSKVHTETEGVFTFGHGEDDTIAITVQGDDNVTFEIDDEQFVTGITNIEGDLFFSEADDYFSINGISGIFICEFSSIGAYSGALYVHDITDNSALLTSDQDKFWLQMLGASFALNDNRLTLTNDADGIWLRDKEIVGLDEGASLKVSEAGNYIANETSLKAKADDIIVGLKGSAYIYDPNNALITKNTPTEEIVQQMTGGDSSVKVTVASGKENITMSGGNLVVVEDTSAKVNITASRGNDTIVSKGENVSIKLNSTGKTDLFATGGKMTLQGYDEATGTGFGTNHGDILSAIDKGAITFRKGKLTLDSAVVTFDKNSELINFYDAAGELQKVGFASDDAKLDASNETESLILVGGNGSTIAGGKGHNQIRLDENSDSTILLNGKNTVENFNVGFDGVKISISADSDFSFDGSNVSVKSGSARALLENISSDDGAARILTLINGKEVKTAIAQAGAVIAAGDELADAYYGKKSGVDFTGFESSLTVDLTKNFHGINQITLGGGQNTLISSSQNETLTGSDGSTEFIFSKDSGRDVIQNFNFDADKINVGNETITAVNVNNAGGVRMEISDSATLTLEDAQGKNFKINNFVALVDKNLTYNGEANYFVATSQNASLTVGEGAEIWLDGSHGKTFVGDIKTLDASTAEGKTSLAGNDLDNTIIAGKGDSTLWGGNLGDDLLFGGAGKNTFFYTVGNGNDTIQGANNGDIVNLSQVTLEQIASTNIASDAVTLNFKDGGSLQINSAAEITYQLQDGSQYSANHAQSTWIKSQPVS